MIFHEFDIFGLFKRPEEFAHPEDPTGLFLTEVSGEQKQEKLPPNLIMFLARIEIERNISRLLEGVTEIWGEREEKRKGGEGK